jgi:membrane-associated protease RseP (regulator of RpoE activity)
MPAPLKLKKSIYDIPVRPLLSMPETRRSNGMSKIERTAWTLPPVIGALYGETGRSSVAKGSIFMVRNLVIASVAALAASGCSTLTEGTSQTIAVTTTPPGALCMLTRDGQPIATIGPTPGTATVDRSTREILVTCHKTGFGDVSYADQADLAAATFGNIMTGGVGFAVDFATGADIKYNGTVNIALARTVTEVPTLRTAAPLTPIDPAIPAPVVAVVPPVPEPAPTIRSATAVAVAVPVPALVAAAAAPRVFGVGVAPLEAQTSNAATPKNGVVVVVVQPGSVAARAGIAEGDIITSLGGREIIGKGDVQRAIAALPAGAAILVHVIRGAHQLDLSAQL